MHYKALIFDMDGTLMDNMSYHKKSWIELFKHHKLDLDYNTFDKKFHKGSLVEIMARLFPEISDIESLSKIGCYKEELYRELFRPHVKSISFLILFLEKMFQKNIPMGLATMGDQHNIDFTFEALNLTNFFHSTTGGHEVKKGKPHPEIFLTAAEKIDVNPSDCLAFEDTLSGILSAKAAGMDVIGITTMFDEKTLLKMGCKRIINNYDEIKV